MSKEGQEVSEFLQHFSKVILPGNDAEEIKINWEIMDGVDWSDLLQVRPEYAEICPWGKLNHVAWSRLLQKQPQFADRCPWNELQEKLSFEHWFDLILAQQIFASKCPENILKEVLEKTLNNKIEPQIKKQLMEMLILFVADYEPALARMLIDFPELADKYVIPWSKLTGYYWCAVLIQQPQFADGYAWEDKLDGNMWSALLQEQPQFADRYKWEDKLDALAWYNLLIKRPEFADRYAWEDIFDNQWWWDNLLRIRPEFINRCKCEKLDVDSLQFLSNKYPEIRKKTLSLLQEIIAKLG